MSKQLSKLSPTSLPILLDMKLNADAGQIIASTDFINQASKKKLGYEMNNNRTSGFLKIIINKTESSEDKYYLLGSGNGVLKINDKAFPFSFSNQPIAIILPLF